MRVAMMQPTFLPWLGYFELILKSDVFIFLDDFQFVYQSYHQRNRLFINRDQVGWLTVPIDKKHCFEKPINETRIQEGAWRNKMWRLIENNYVKTPFFEEYAEQIYPFIVESKVSLAEQNMGLIRLLSDFLGKSPDTFLQSSYLSVSGKRSLLVKNLLEAVQADTYLVAHGSFDYMRQDGVFPSEGIETLFQDVHLKEYPQYGSTNGFVPYLSILDALFNVGAEKTRDLVLASTEHWLTWDEMASRADVVVDSETGDEVIDEKR